MPAYPSKLRALLYAIDELVRRALRSEKSRWTSTFLRRLSDKNLSEPRRLTLGAILASEARSRGSATLARDVWIAGRDLWENANRPTIAALACEAAAWLEDASTFEDAMTVADRLLTDTARARLQFLREVYLKQSAADVPRLLRLPVPLPHVGYLTYVDDYARARVADSENRFDVALEYYRKAIQSLPQDHAAYQFALSRCNKILNTKSA